MGREIFGCEEVDGHAESFLKLDLQTTQVKQGGTRKCVDQQVQIAAVPIVTMDNGAKDARVAQLTSLDDSANHIAILLKDF